jgi:hypothetical protein
MVKARREVTAEFDVAEAMRQTAGQLSADARAYRARVEDLCAQARDLCAQARELRTRSKRTRLRHVGR